MRKIYLTTIISLSILSFAYGQNSDIYRISEQQKIFELSAIWKELSYNFANMDNCEVDLDSLYLAYIPIIQKTENDVDYCNAIKRFMAHFNNGHTYAHCPSYLSPCISHPGIETELVSNKVLIKNVIVRHADKLNIGDEIIEINGIDAIDYFKTFRCPYVGTSNPENRLSLSMFGMLTYGEFREDSLSLKIKKAAGVHTIVIYNDFTEYSSEENLKTTDHWVIEKNSRESNFFMEDTAAGWVYARLNTADQELSDFFMRHYPKILKSENFIIDLSMNTGGGSGYFTGFINLLINSDTICSYVEYTRNNNALHKAWASIKLHYHSDHDVPEFYKTAYYPYYYNTSFDTIMHQGWRNRIPSSYRYQGNVYVITDRLTASAAEYFVIMLSQNPNISFLGGKTNGALGQPLVTDLPSGIRFFINSTKTYDFNGNDISSGFTPDYECDFSSLYKINNAEEQLKNLIETITAIQNDE
ncbi:hypothetical protein LJC68_06030 [Bacteroidales bacterium OttesenSCG-928-B11]|nr:hypothetical protein [Bacteroidales bacterium OttesenSCG-928-E04]MDL2312417.1 hypothetical protein [Bacteroidales bacterium OttesenSCG-928-B11]MDL2326320.1 hypothetical protein [Bacteroidales bacterium OttesenSCG-928-A14]